MPIKSAAFKALRQSRKHQERNAIAKAQIGDAKRAVRKAIQAGDKKKAAEAAAAAVRLLDKGYSRGIIKRNAASRNKSRLLKSISALSAKK
jgi:small subunit ribosomal protein S20